MWEGEWVLLVHLQRLQTTGQVAVDSAGVPVPTQPLPHQTPKSPHLTMPLLPRLQTEG